MFWPQLLYGIDVKKFFYVFLFWPRFIRFNVFFIFQNVFFIFKNVGKVQSGSRLTRSTFKEQQRNRPMIFLLHVE